MAKFLFDVFKTFFPFFLWKKTYIPQSSRAAVGSWKLQRIISCYKHDRPGDKTGRRLPQTLQRRTIKFC